MATIHDSYKLSNVTDQQQTKLNQGILGKDDFLKLLITQLQNQDPTNPMDDREFIVQMAQFSTLEQMTNMNSSIRQFVNLQTSQSLVSHSELIGKEIQWQREIDINEYQTKVEYVTNVVTSVKLESNGQVRVQLDDGRWIGNDQVVQISQLVKKEPENAKNTEVE